MRITGLEAIASVHHSGGVPTWVTFEELVAGGMLVKGAIVSRWKVQVGVCSLHAYGAS